MRKKLFAVIMSAMMMITFMPAMAFAKDLGPELYVPSAQGNIITVSDVTTWADDVDGINPAAFVYDGKGHTVTYTKPVNGFDSTDLVKKEVQVEFGKWKTVITVNEMIGREFSKAEVAAATVDYNTYYKAPTATAGTWSGFKTDAPVLKDAGEYSVIIRMTYANPKTAETETILKATLNVNVLKRPVWVVEPAGVVLQSKVYDGKGFALSDKDFTMRAYSATMVDKWPTDYPYSKVASANYASYSGLVTGDTLFTGANATKADAGVYMVAWNSLTTNTNYMVVNMPAPGNAFKLVIEKADPTVKITSNTLTIKRGKNAKVKYSTNFGKATLKKTSGNAKITLKNGKLYVKKSLKKGTYKVTLKASVAKDTNWNAAKRVKTLKIKVY